MGKSSKKKKNNADFVKPKLKVGKKKPNATNFTNIAFKSSAINVLAQLEEKTEPTNRRNQSLKDILSQLNHYNDNTRQDATESLKNFFVQHPSSLHQNLSVFIPKLLSKSVDVHFNVRKNFILCLEHVFKNVTDNEIQPFFPIIMAHLRCAMTHINDEIQADSLKLLDLCLGWFPSHFLENCEKVFQNLLDMVCQSQGSSLKNQTFAKRSVQKTVNRDMSMKPSGKISSLKTRKESLEKLLKIVSLVFQSKKTEEYSNETVDHVALPSVVSSFTLLKYACLHHQDDHKDQLDPNEKLTVVSDNLKSIKEVILSFVPVLFQCWNDCISSSYASSLMDKDSTLALMISIVSILKGIASSSSEGKDLISFTKAYFEDFTTCFLGHFPFSSSTLQHKSTKQQESQTNVTYLNISICEVYCKMISSNHALVEENLDEFEKVLGYIKSISHTLRVSKNAERLDCIQSTVCVLLELSFNLRSSREKKASKVCSIVCDILNNFTMMYKDSKITSTKCQLLPILEDLLQIMDSVKCPPDGIKHVFELWINLLPDDLQRCEPENSAFILRIITIMSTVFIQKRIPEVTESRLHCTVNHVLDAPKSIFTSIACDLLVQKRFLELVYHLPHVEKDVVKNLSFLCHRHRTPTAIKHYIIHILYYCLLKKSIDTELFLSFVLSTVVGMPFSKLESIQTLQEQLEFNEIKSFKYRIKFSFKSVKEKKDLVTDHAKFCETALDLVETLDCREDILGMLVPAMDQLLTKCHILPDVTVIGVLTLLRRLRKSSCLTANENFKMFFDNVAALMFSIMLYHCYNERRKIESSPFDDIVDTMCCIMDKDDYLLNGFLNNAVKAYGSVEDDIITKGLWLLRRRPMLNLKLEQIFVNDERTKKIRELFNRYISSISI